MKKAYICYLLALLLVIFSFFPHNYQIPCLAIAAGLVSYGFSQPEEPNE